MEEICRFFESLQIPEYVVRHNIARFERHPDIAAEFMDWLHTKQYRTENAVSVRGYTAEAIFEKAPFLNGAGAFNFLITLRESPEKAEAILAEGFKRK